MHMKLIKILLVLSFSLSHFVMYGQIFEDSVKSTLSVLESTLKNKDIDLSKSVTTEHTTISTGLWTSMLPQILNNIEFEALELADGDFLVRGDTTIVKVDISFKNGKKKASRIALDSNNKLLYVEYFDKLYGSSHFQKSKLVGTFPFEVKNGSIIVTVKINDNTQLVKLLFDTGADGMAIRKTLADSLSLQTTYSRQTNVVGGQMQVNISSGNTIYLTDSLTLKNRNIAIFEHMGSADGILGIGLANSYITEVNFDKQVISLYTLGIHEYKDKGATLPISHLRGLVMVPSSLNLTGKKAITGNFIMDTGANYHLILFSRYVRKNRLLLSGFKPEGQASTVSMGHSTPVFYGKAYEFRIGDNIVLNDMPITLQSSTGEDTTPEGWPDGSIGVQVFNQFNFTIDLLSKKLHLTPRD